MQNILDETIKKIVDKRFNQAYSHPLINRRSTIHKNKDYFPYISTPSEGMAKLAKIIVQNHKEGLSFCDAGCGIPAIPLIMSDLGYKAHGVEFTKEYAEAFPKIVRYGDILTYDFKEFDILYAFSPIMKKEIMEKAVINIQNTMKKGATFYFWSIAVDPKPLGFIRVENTTFNKFVK